MPIVHARSVAEARTALAELPSPIVVIPVFNGYEDTVRCYESVLAHTPATHGVLVVDDAGADRAPIEILDKVADRLDEVVVVLHRNENGGFVQACNDAFAATAGRDVVLLNSDCAVGPGWLEGMVDAASSSSLVATVTALTNHGSIVSVPRRNTPVSQLPGGMDPTTAAERVARASLRLRPTLPTAVGHCVLIRRLALDLVGGFDEAFGAGYGEEVDFSLRALQAGLRHVCADDVFVYHRGGGSFGIDARQRQDTNEAIINVRYPWYRRSVIAAESDECSPLALALERARIALTGMTIGVDAMTVGRHTTGTQVVVFETLCALAQLFDGDEIVVFHSPELPTALARAIDELPGTRRVEMEGPKPDTDTLVDVIYRPYQVTDIAELRWLKAVGRRVIVNQLDNIAWSNPTYFASINQWTRFRELTRLVLASADGVAFISSAAASEVEAEGALAEATPRRVVWCGTDHCRSAEAGSVRPGGLPDDDVPFLLGVGAPFHHKNRVFTLRLLERLRTGGWEGRLVLSGPTPSVGDSRGREAAELLVNAGLGDAVVDLGDVSEPEKNWLYEHAALCVYPSVVEGFGLVPFEAANHDLPVLTTRQGGLGEVLPEEVVALDGFDLDEAVALAHELLTNPVAAEIQCSLMRTRALEYTWERTATEVIGLIHDVLSRPRSRVTGIVGLQLDPPDIERPRLATAVGRSLETVVQGTKGTTGLKQLISPEGSKRQHRLRQFINWVRRTTGVQAGS